MSQYGNVPPVPARHVSDTHIVVPAVNDHTVTDRDGNVTRHKSYKKAVRYAESIVVSEGYRPAVAPVYPVDK